MKWHGRLARVSVSCFARAGRSRELWQMKTSNNERRTGGRSQQYWRLGVGCWLFASREPSPSPCRCVKSLNMYPAARSVSTTGRDARSTRRRGRLRHFVNGPEGFQVGLTWFIFDLSAWRLPALAVDLFIEQPGRKDGLKFQAWSANARVKECTASSSGGRASSARSPAPGEQAGHFELADGEATVGAGFCAFFLGEILRPLRRWIPLDRL